MSFSSTCKSVHLVKSDKHVALVCEAQDKKGTFGKSSLNLNTCIGNNNGTLEWTPSSVGNFAASSTDITLFTSSKGPLLIAKCKTTTGMLQKSQLVLDERITNLDGCLVFQ